MNTDTFLHRFINRQAVKRGLLKGYGLEHGSGSFYLDEIPGWDTLVQARYYGAPHRLDSVMCFRELKTNTFWINAVAIGVRAISPFGLSRLIKKEIPKAKINIIPFNLLIAIGTHHTGTAKLIRQNERITQDDFIITHQDDTKEFILENFKVIPGSEPSGTSFELLAFREIKDSAGKIVKPEIRFDILLDKDKGLFLKENNCAIITQTTLWHSHSEVADYTIPDGLPDAGSKFNAQERSYDLNMFRREQERSAYNQYGKKQLDTSFSTNNENFLDLEFARICTLYNRPKEDSVIISYHKPGGFGLKYSPLPTVKEVDGQDVTTKYSPSYWLLGTDEGSYFASHIPQFKNVLEAYEVIKHPEVRRHQALYQETLPVKRQGEWFFIPFLEDERIDNVYDTEVPTAKHVTVEMLAERMHISVDDANSLFTFQALPKDNKGSNDHIGRIWKIGNKIFATGTIKHSGREHRNVKLYNKIYRVFRNTSRANYSIEGRMVD